MPAIKIIRLLHLVCFLILTSQLLFYVVVMGDAMKKTGINNFIELRKIVDPLVHLRHIPFYYACLVLGIILLVLMHRQWNSLVFTTTVFATVMLIADMVIAVKINVPINQHLNAYQFGTIDKSLETLRLKWIYFIELRGWISMAGMVSLFVGLIFGKR